MKMINFLLLANLFTYLFAFQSGFSFKAFPETIVATGESIISEAVSQFKNLYTLKKNFTIGSGITSIDVELKKMELDFPNNPAFILEFLPNEICKMTVSIKSAKVTSIARLKKVYKEDVKVYFILNNLDAKFGLQIRIVDGKLLFSVDSVKVDLDFKIDFEGAIIGKIAKLLKSFIVSKVKDTLFTLNSIEFKKELSSQLTSKAAEFVPIAKLNENITIVSDLHGPVVLEDSFRLEGTMLPILKYQAEKQKTETNIYIIPNMDAVENKLYEIKLSEDYLNGLLAKFDEILETQLNIRVEGLTTDSLSYVLWGITKFGSHPVKMVVTPLDLIKLEHFGEDSVSLNLYQSIQLVVLDDSANPVILEMNLRMIADLQLKVESFNYKLELFHLDLQDVVIVTNLTNSPLNVAFFLFKFIPNFVIDLTTRLYGYGILPRIKVNDIEVKLKDLKFENGELVTRVGVQNESLTSFINLKKIFIDYLGFKE